MKPTLENITKSVKKHPSMIQGCYIFGSRVYGTNSQSSDWDILLIGNSSVDHLEYNNENLNIHLITLNEFKRRLDNNDIGAMECYFSPEWAAIKRIENIKFILKPERFRHNISHTTSNSWIKAKKKLELGFYEIGLKSLFHSLRIAKFGDQFCKKGQFDFESMNYIWDEINKKEWTWEELNERYRPIRNKLLTEFRKNFEN